MLDILGVCVHLAESLKEESLLRFSGGRPGSEGDGHELRREGPPWPAVADSKESEVGPIYFILNRN